MTPRTMMAIAVAPPGSSDVLVAQMRPTPVPSGRELLIRVVGAGVNRPDILQRQGVYPPPPGAPDTLGLEVAGVVEACGPDATRFGVGATVCALLPGGGYAEYALVDERNALPVPAGLSMVEAAAVPETFFTVWTNVFERGGLQAGETFLVHGGTSGIGTTAIQLAKAFGATVFATAGSPAKVQACIDLGADLAVDYQAEDFVAAVKAATGGRGVDLILDMVGGDYIARNHEAAAVEGRIVQIAFLKGAKATVDFRRLMMNRLTHTGSTLRPRSVEQKEAIAWALQDKVWPLLEAGRVRPVIHATFPLAQAAAAHALMESGAHIGKIVLTP